ncbi:hypothetical protein FQZ97_739010 [compost metagenome]
MQRHLHSRHRRQQLALRLSKLLDGRYQLASIAVGGPLALGKIRDSPLCQLQRLFHDLNRANRGHQAKYNPRQSRVGTRFQQTEP